MRDLLFSQYIVQRLIFLGNIVYSDLFLLKTLCNDFVSLVHCAVIFFPQRILYSDYLSS